MPNFTANGQLKAALQQVNLRGKDMSFTIIGHTKAYEYRDRWGDIEDENPGAFEVKHFRNSAEAEFLKAWAHAEFHQTFEELVILVDGEPILQLDEDVFWSFEERKEAYKPAIQAEHEAAEAIRQAAEEAEAKALLEKAREQSRARDMAALETLQRRLGIIE